MKVSDLIKNTPDYGTVLKFRYIKPAKVSIFSTTKNTRDRVVLFDQIKDGDIVGYDLTDLISQTQSGVFSAKAKNIAPRLQIKRFKGNRITNLQTC